MDAYCIGRDQPTKYGADWAGAFLAGSSYSEYDDQDYFTVEQRLLVHPSVEATQEAVQARITAAIAEAGWVQVADVNGRSWDCPSRPRTDKHPTESKTRWHAARPPEES